MPKSTTYKNTISPLKSLVQDRFFIIMMKICLVLLLISILYYQLLGRDDISLGRLATLFAEQLSIQNLPIILLVALLMPLNWFFETKKWLALMENIQAIKMKDALVAVMSGVTFSLFTPNRVGEYGGRMLLVDADKRYLSVLATMVGIVSQWIVLIVGGWWAMVTFLGIGILPVSMPLFSGLVLVGVLLTAGLFLCYYNLQKIIEPLSRFKYIKKWTAKMEVSGFDYYSFGELNRAVFYSFSRYMIYSFQYLLLLSFFGFEASAFHSFLGVLIVYLLQTGIPLPPSTGLLARGNIALFIFGYISVSTTAGTVVLAATFSLWIINVVLPALLGAFFITQLGWKYPKPKQKEE